MLVYLQENDIFDDVNDVIGAWDKQIDRAAQNIENYVITRIRSIMYKHKTQHDKVYDSVSRGHALCKKLIAELSNDIQEFRVVEQPVPTYAGYSGASSLTENVTKSQWVNRGTIESHMSDEERSTVYKVNNLLMQAEEDLKGISGSMREFMSSITVENSRLDKVLREHVYKTVDIDEIVNIQRIDYDIIEAMIIEFTDANNIIVSEQMGAAIESLSSVFQHIIQLLHYYQLLSKTCFGL